MPVPLGDWREHGQRGNRKGTMTRRPIHLTGDTSKDVSALATRLGDDVQESAEVCRILSEFGTDESLEALVASAANPDQWHRRLAIEAIGDHKLGRQASAVVRRSLSDQSPYVVRTACQAVANLKLKDARQDILPLLKADDPSTGTVVVEALGAISDDSDFDTLLKIIDYDDHPDVQASAEGALKQLVGAHNWRILFDRWRGHAEQDSRRWVCELAGQYGDVRDIRKLEGLTHDQSLHVRVAVRRAIHKLRGEPEDVPQPLPHGKRRPRGVPEPPKQDGWQEIEYELSENAELNDRVSLILNEACHVFRHHAEGVWRSHDKDAYASLLAEELKANPWLARSLLNIGDRVISMLTYRAIELRKMKTSNDKPEQRG